MRVIHKQFIDFRSGNEIKIQLPINSRILSCDFQKGELAIWYMFDVESAHITTEFKLYVFRTGEAMPDVVDSLQFVATANDDDSLFPFVLHVFRIATSMTYEFGPIEATGELKKFIDNLKPKE